MRTYAMLILGFCCFSGCVFNQIQGSGIVKNETREVSGFQEVSLSGVGEVTIDFGDKESVTVTTDDNLLPFLETTVENGTLKLKTAHNTSFSTSNGIKFHVTMKELKGLHVSGTGDMTAKQVKANNLKVHLSGTGSINLQGVADKIDVHVSGTGSFQGSELHVKKATIHNSGVGSSSIYVTEELDAHVSGVGSVEYSGSPKNVKTKVSGIGSVRSK